MCGSKKENKIKLAPAYGCRKSTIVQPQGAKHAQPISWQAWLLILKTDPFGLMFVNV